MLGMFSNFIKTKKNVYIVVAMMISVSMLLAGCNGSEEGATEPPPYRGDEYATYIHDALESVSKDSEPTSIPLPDKDKDRVVQVTDNAGDDSSIYVSASEALPEESGVTPLFGEDIPSSSTDATAGENGENSSEVSNEDDSSSSMESEEPKELTPDTFDVGTCCIYIDGTIDTSYGSDIIKAINKARVDLGYPALNEKQGLDTCADRRTREIACFLNHYRPNATPFYSLAPQYFKAEMLAIDGAKAEETVDAWIADPYSRQLVFTNKYTSVGAACFKCNTLNCVVVAFGY